MDTHITEAPAGSSKPVTKLATDSLITVIGVGGAGGNAVNNMIQANLEGVGFVVANTDAQALEQTLCDHKIQLGPELTQGLGAGAQPDVGAAAAEETLAEITAAIDGASMLFITAGMGGGTGTGAAPIVARAAREAGLLTVGVVSKPFAFEGARRMQLAEEGIEELSKYVDTLIVIPNQNLFLIADAQTTFADAFNMADHVLLSGVRGVTDLVVLPGLINLDFADIRSIMTDMGRAVMGTGKAKGENRALEAAEAAISNPLLDDVSIKGAESVLINITGGLDLALNEVDVAAIRIRSEVDPNANIIFGSAFDQNLDGAMRVSVIATGKDHAAADKPAEKSSAIVTGNVISQNTNGQATGQIALVRSTTEAPSEANDGTEQELAPVPVPVPPEMRFVVADLAVGVRLFKVPLPKVAEVRNASHGKRMQIFNTLEKAKAAADNLAQRIAYRRVAEGLPEEDPNMLPQNYERWQEKDVPDYIF